MFKGRASSAPIISEKQHFRMYKVHKVWVFAAITGISFLSMMNTGLLETHADTTGTAVAAAPETPTGQQGSTNASNVNTGTADQNGTTNSSEANASANNATAPSTDNVTDFNQKVSDYAKQKNTYEAAKQAYEAAQQQVNSEQTAYQQSVNDYNQKKADYQTEQTTYQSEKSVYDKAKQNATDQASTAAEDNQRLTDAENALNTNNTQLTNAKQSYDANLNIYNQAKDEYTQSLAAYTQLNDQIKATEATYNQQLSDYQTKLAAYNDDATAFNSAQNDYQQKANALKEQIQSYQRQLAQYQPLVDAYNQAKTKYEATKVNYDAGVSQLSTHFNETGYQDALNAYNMQKSSYEAIKTTYDVAKADYDQKLAAGEATDPNFDTIEATYHTAYQDYLTAQQAYNQADTLRQQQTVAAANQNNQFPELQSEYDVAQSDYQAAETKYQAIKPEYDSLYSQVAALNQQANQLDQKHDTQLVEQQAQLNTEKQALEGLQATNQITANQISDLQDQYSNVKTQYEATETNYADVQHQHDVLATQLNALQDQYAAAKADFDQATANYQAAENKLTNLQNFYNQVKSDYDAAHQSYVEANDQFQHAQDAVTASQETLKSSQALFKSLQTTYQSAKATYDKLAGKLPALQADYQNQLAQYNQDLAAFQTYMAAVQTYQDALAKLTTDVTPAQTLANNKVTAANTAGEKVNSDITAVNAALDNVNWDDAAWVSDFNTKLSQLTTDKTALDTAQNGLADAVNTYDQALNTYESQTGTAEPSALNTPNAMADYTSTVSVLTTILANLQTAKTYNTTLAASLKTVQDAANALNTAITTANGRIAQTVTDSQNGTDLTNDLVALNTSKSDLNTKYTTFNSAVTAVNDQDAGMISTNTLNELTQQQTQNTNNLNNFITAATNYKNQTDDYNTQLAKYNAAVAAKQTADAAVTTANTAANNANANLTSLATLLATPKPNDSDWLTQVNNLVTQLKATTLNHSDLDTLVSDYQSKLDALNSGLNAVEKVDPQAPNTIANYDQLADQFNTDLQTKLTALQANLNQYQTGTAVNTAATTLSSALTKLNTAIQAVKPNLTSDQLTTDLATLDTAKTAYDSALTAYNTAVDTYNATAPADKQGTKVDISQNSSDTDYNNFKLSAKVAVALNQATNQNNTLQQAVTDTQTALTTLSSAVKDYNDTVGAATKPTATQLQAKTDAVHQAQNAVKTDVTKLVAANDAYKQSLTDYQTALDAYDTATGKTKQAVVPGFDNPSDTTQAWGKFQQEVQALNTDYQTYSDSDVTSTTAPAKNNQVMKTNLDNLQGNGALSTSVKVLTQKVAQINDLAQKVNDANTKFQAEVKAANDDGRWELFYAGDNGLLSLYNQLITAAYNYLDAVNGTTTPLTDQTVSVDNGKSFNITTPGAAKANTGTDVNSRSYQSVVDDFNNAVNTYNTTAPADKQLSLVSTTDFNTQVTTLKTTLEKADGFEVQATAGFKTLANRAADEKQNAIALAGLDPNSQTYTSTTDGYHATHYNRFPTSINILGDFIKDTSDNPWPAVLASGWDNVDFISDSLNLTGHGDYGGNLTAVNGQQYTGLKDPNVITNYLATSPIYSNSAESTDDSLLSNGLQPTYTIDGVTYYFAALAVTSKENPDGTFTSTDQLITFDTPDVKDAIKNLPLRTVIGDKNDTMRVMVYYLPEVSYSKYFLTVPEQTAIKVTTPTVDSSLAKLTDEPTLNTSATPVQTQLTSLKYQDGQTVTPSFDNQFKAPVAPDLTLSTPTKPTPKATKLAGTTLTTVTAPNVPDKQIDHLTGVGQLSLNIPAQPTTPTKAKNPTPPTKPSVPTAPSAMPNGPQDINLAVTGVTDVTAPDKLNIQTPNKPVEPNQPNISIQTPTTPVGPEEPANQPEKPGTVQPLKGDVPPLSLNSVTPPDPMDAPDQPVTPWTPLEGVVPPIEPERPTTPNTPTTPIVPGTPERSQVPPEPNTPSNPEEPGNPVEPDIPEKGQAVEGNIKTSEASVSLQKVSAAQTVSVKAPKGHQATTTKRLPQTGENSENGLALLGLAILSSLGLLGFGKKKRQN